ncbi:MAG: YdbH domain-containing protein, partial [Gammaproteobacteria bacterium]|nr:YdbH domain-containing protein [Gammaproteobacteria bacterium]
NPVPSSNPSVQLVNDALSNYQYRTLDTEVYYDDNGDLTMAVQLQGINPDLNGGQPINLNVNISNNIPSLLRSLQASRVITDALEQSLSR